MIPFGEWKPDVYDLNSPQSGEASGVLPGSNSYHPWPALNAFSAAVDSAGRGALLTRTSSGTYTNAVGTATKLYKFSSATAWLDFSGTAYNLPSDERWSMAQFGPTIIAVNGNDAPQSLDIDAGIAFANLAGSPPIARFVRSVGDFVFLGRTSNYPTGVEWSGLNDATWWTHGQRSSDYQIFPDGGYVTGITALETGLIFQENAVRRFAQTADRAIFNFAKVDDGQGCIAPDSLVSIKGTAYYLSRTGFCKIGANTGYVSVPLGLEVVDRWFQDNINLGRLPTISGSADPRRDRVFWLAPSTGTTGYQFDILICYDILLNKWTHTTVSASMLFPGATPGYTLEGLDALYPNLDAMTPSLDDASLVGGTPYLAALDSSFKMAFFNGTNQAAIVQTGEFQAIPGKRAFVSGFRPIGDPMNVTGRIATRERPQGTPSWSASASVTNEGMVPVRASARLHRVELAVAAGQSWTHLQGIDFGDGDVSPDGLR